MRLIDADAYLDSIKPRGISDELWKECKEYKSVMSFPSAQSEIIRCKDCKHSEHWYRDKRRCFLWHETGIDVFEDGYCNYAKRRTDADVRGEQDE